MSNAAEFIDKYKVFENAVRTTYGLGNEESIRNFLHTQTKFARYQSEIACCQETRNLLQHQPLIKGEYPIEPSDKLIAVLDGLTAMVLDRKTCADICVKADRVFSAAPHDSVKRAMAVMREKRYSCIPIVDGDNKVVGIFSEGSIFDYLADEGIVDLDEGLRFEDLGKYIEPNGREGTLHLFLPHYYLVDKLVNRIESASNAMERFEVAIITNKGGKTEPMQGIVTPWDVIDNDNL